MASKKLKSSFFSQPTQCLEAAAFLTRSQENDDPKDVEQTGGEDAIPRPEERRLRPGACFMVSREEPWPQIMVMYF
jgi:hypothetical protein